VKFLDFLNMKYRKSSIDICHNILQAKAMYIGKIDICHLHPDKRRFVTFSLVTEMTDLKVR